MKTKLLALKVVALSMVLTSATPVLAKSKTDCGPQQKEIFMLALTAMKLSSRMASSMKSVALDYERAGYGGDYKKQEYLISLDGKVGQVNQVLTVGKDEVRDMLKNSLGCFPGLSQSDIVDIMTRMSEI